MTVYFHEPPPQQRVGGLDLAIQTLRSYLRAVGVSVKTNSESFAAPNGPADQAIVHFHGLWQPQFLKISRHCRACEIPYVVSPHGMLEPWAWKHKRWKKLPYYLLFERRLLRGAASLVATSDMEAVNLRKFLPRARCSIIPLGLPDDHHPDYARARKQLGWRPNEKILLFLSRIHPKKGLDILIKALAALGRSAIGDVRLVVIGGGDPAYVGSVRALAAGRKDQLPQVDWLGEIWGDKKWPYLQGADLFCLPSFSENFGLAVLEALQVGTRVLTTNAVPWHFLDEWNAGFIVEPSEEAVAHGVKSFLKQAQWSDDQRLALAGRVVEKFGWETIGPQYLELYRGLTEGSREFATANCP